jgi:hypothetical protein
MKKVLVRIGITAAVLYGLLFTVVLCAMSLPPTQFGRFMRYAPAPLVWGGLPAEKMWRWARSGTLSVGDLAPEFTLPLRDHSRAVTLSSYRGKKPVVLVFGSYT